MFLLNFLLFPSPQITTVKFCSSNLLNILQVQFEIVLLQCWQQTSPDPEIKTYSERKKNKVKTVQSHLFSIAFEIVKFILSELIFGNLPSC